jgi:hypothetical protein
MDSNIYLLMLKTIVGVLEVFFEYMGYKKASVPVTITGAQPKIQSFLSYLL